MLQSNPKQTGQKDLFRSRLDQMIDMNHALVTLSRLINWSSLEQSLSQYYCPGNGRPGASIRLMAGLCLLKDQSGLSDEALCAAWCENPYYQYFCGEEFFQHRFPVEPPSLSIFRKRIGEAGIEILLQATLQAGIRSGVVTAREIETVTVDTTVQEKAVAFPTDASLCHKARKALVKLAKEHGIPLRQSYSRKGKEALFWVNRYMAARQMKRGRAQVKRLRNYLGRVMRDIQRGCNSQPELAALLREAMDKAAIIYTQVLNKDAKEKLYSWHAPETECIAKGKAHKKYEYGCKASYVVTNGSNFIVGARALHGRPYDGHTLKDSLEQVKRLSNVTVREAHVDLGFRNHGIEDKETDIIFSRQKQGITSAKRKRQKRRNAIEPIIGHCKNDRKTSPKNYLTGKLGDQINAISMAIGFNLRKILAVIIWCLIQIAFCLFHTRPYQMNRYSVRK